MCSRKIETIDISHLTVRKNLMSSCTLVTQVSAQAPAPSTLHWQRTWASRWDNPITHCWTPRPAPRLGRAISSWKIIVRVCGFWASSVSSVVDGIAKREQRMCQSHVRADSVLHSLHACSCSPGWSTGQPSGLFICKMRLMPLPSLTAVLRISPLGTQIFMLCYRNSLWVKDCGVFNCWTGEGVGSGSIRTRFWNWICCSAQVSLPGYHS